MSYSFCTIVTQSHIPWAMALHESLTAFDPEVDFHVLVTDAPEPAIPDGAQGHITMHDLSAVDDGGLGTAMQKEYGDDPDALRWSLKPVFMQKLMATSDRVLYGDCDLYFFGDYRFLVDELEVSSVLLTPHWRCSRISDDAYNFRLLFTEGLYNAGFVGASHWGRDALDHWAKNSLASCKDDRRNGIYDDQTHLNLLPVMFDGVHVVKHRGCNVANWNQVECRRVKREDGSVWINDRDPIVFIHFTESLARGVLSDLDPHLRPHLRRFHDALERWSPGFDYIGRVRRKVERERKDWRRKLRYYATRVVERLLGSLGLRH